MSATPLVLVAHGSADPRAAATVEQVAAEVAVGHDGPVLLSYLDIATPALADVLVEAAAMAGGEPIVVLPMLLSTGYHVSRDIPDVLARSGVPALVTRHLGPDALLARAGRERLVEVGVDPADPSWGIVVAGVGSSDPAGIDEVGAAAELLTTGTAWRAAPAFATTRPTVDDAAARLRAAGATRIAVSPYVLAPGRLPDLIAAAAADAVAEPLGTHPCVIRAALARVATTVGRPAPADLEDAAV